MYKITKGGMLEVTSETAQTSYTFKWKIKTFDKLYPVGTEKFDPFESPKFTAGEDIGKKSEWRVSIKGADGHLGCYLYLSTSEDNDKVLPIRTHIKLGLGNAVNPFLCAGNFNQTYTTTKGWGYTKFIKISDLYAKKNYLLQDNSLQICVELTIFGNLTSLTMPTSVKTKDPGTEKKFVTDFDSLFQSKLFSDVEVKCEGETFNCHKAILSARSEVFRTMFSQRMIEANSSKVTIKDMDPRVMEVLLKYIYTGRVDLPSGGSVKFNEVIYGAEKYQLAELKNVCFNKMLEKMSEKNVGELVETSQMYNANDEVKKVIKDYCKQRLVRLLDNSEFAAIFCKYREVFYKN